MENSQKTPSLSYGKTFCHMGIVRTVLFCVRFSLTLVITVVVIMLVIALLDAEGALSRNMEGGAELMSLHEALVVAEQLGQDVSEQKYQLYTFWLDQNPWIQKVVVWPGFIFAYFSALLYLQKLSEIYYKEPNTWVTAELLKEESFVKVYAGFKVLLIVAWIVVNHLLVGHFLEDPFAYLLEE